MIKRFYYKILDWVYPELKLLSEKFEDNQRLLLEVHNLLDTEIDLIEKDMLFYKSISEQLVLQSPDMTWVKDLNGRYIMANDAIKNNLLCSCNVEGRLDTELANQARAKYGVENHTFGELCRNSDDIVMRYVKDGTWGDEPNQGRFYEYGKVKGKMLYLEVNKFPLFIKDEFYGIAGFGRDLTPYVEALNSSKCGCCNDMPEVFDLFKFDERER